MTSWGDWANTNTSSHNIEADIRWAIDSIYNATPQPTQMIVSPATYKAFDWLLRKTTITTTYEIIPGSLRVLALRRRLRRRLRRFIQRRRWAYEDWQEARR